MPVVNKKYIATDNFSVVLLPGPSTIFGEQKWYAGAGSPSMEGVS